MKTKGSPNVLFFVKASDFDMLSELAAGRIEAELFYGGNAEDLLTLLASPPKEDVVIVIDMSLLKKTHNFNRQIVNKIRNKTSTPFILISNLDKTRLNTHLFKLLHTEHLYYPVNSVLYLCALEKSITKVRLFSKNKKLEHEKAKHTNNVKLLCNIGAALIAERNIDNLLKLILSSARKLTGADSGSIYIVDERGFLDTDSGAERGKKLRFMMSQSDSVKIPFNQFSIDIDKRSIAGYVALTQKVLNIEDVYDLPSNSPYRFNKKIDENIGYRTCSVLGVPMSNQKGNVIGILQLINKKRKGVARLDSLDKVKIEVIPFDEGDIDIILSLAGQAAVSLENSMLYSDIKELFKALVKASVSTIEARDPTTSGHSERVSKLATAFAEKISKSTRGIYSDIDFSEDQILGLEYASLLHDFGKVGVKEEVLVKANKLNDCDLKAIKSRFDYIKCLYMLDSYKEQLNCIIENGKEIYLAKAEQYAYDIKKKIDKLDKAFKIIEKANRPYKMTRPLGQMVTRLAEERFYSPDGEHKQFLTKEEYINLTTSIGSLNEDERREVESHVIHTYNFLKNIPWSKDMKNIPEIAYLHHEYLNGSGYPRGVTSEEIPLEARILAISDKFDALTAQDRPYKKAISAEEALKILKEEAKDNRIDRGLLDIFIRERVYEAVIADLEART